jgi:peptidoglycan/LPS O-acetylase OafA/YrhL
MHLPGNGDGWIVSHAVNSHSGFDAGAGQSRMGYRPEIDGLRSLAILPVLLFHSGVPGFTGGFVGVDIFFVISGFLITGIIADELAAGRFSILDFYERRARRILPALTFFSLLTLVAAWLFFLPDFFEDFSRSLVAVATFTSNLYFWKYSGYFEHSAHLRPLLHTWSLAVEEQFYIFMPILMWALYRYARRFLFWALAIGAALSLALSIYATSLAPTANFFLLPTRAWELLLGSLLAVASVRKLPSGLNSVLAFAGVAAIAVAVFGYTEATPFPGLTALLPCMGAVLIILTGRNTPVGAVLSTRPIVFIGKISYSLYLAHWPVVVFIRYVTLKEPTMLHAVVIILVSFALAFFSWKFVESPFRVRRAAATRSRLVVLPGAAATLVVLAAVGMAGIWSSGFPSRFPDYLALRSQIDAVERNEPSRSWRNGTCFFEDGKEVSRWNADACMLVGSPGPATLLWGDSFAAHYVPGLMAHAAAVPGRLYQYTYAGCPPVLAYYSYARPACTPFNQRAVELIKALEVKTVILSARWLDLRSRGLDLLAGTIEELRSLGVKVVVIGQSPAFVTNVDVIAYANRAAQGERATWFTLVDRHFNEELKKVSAGAAFVDPIAIGCEAGRCPYLEGGRFLYFDSAHYSNFGSAHMVKTLLPLIVAKPEAELISHQAN